MSDGDISQYHYNNPSFAVVGSITWTSLTIAIIFVALNLRKHISSDYDSQLKIGIIICLIDEIVIIILLGIALFMYKIAEPFLILVNVLLSVLVIFFYFFVQEILTLYVWKYCSENRQMRKKIVKEKINRTVMFQYDYPMHEAGFFSKIRIRDLYVKHAYYIQGSGRIFYFFTRKIFTYAEAYSFQQENSYIIYLYILTVPIMMIWEYILNQTETIKVGDFNLKSLFRVYILVYTFIATTCLQSFAKSFEKILPFIKFDMQLSTLVYIKTFFDYWGSLVRVTSMTLEDYDDFDTYQLLFVSIFSAFLCVMSGLQYFILSPKQMGYHVSRSLIVGDMFSESDDSVRSAPSETQKRPSLIGKICLKCNF